MKLYESISDHKMMCKSRLFQSLVENTNKKTKHNLFIIKCFYL